MGRPIYYSSQIKNEEEMDGSGIVHTLFDDRVIFYSGITDEQPISTTITNILQMFKKDPNKPVNLIINTVGGSVMDMFALYDVITFVQSRGMPIHTTALGKVMSAGVILLACGAKGNRKIGESATVMIHNVYETNSSGDIFEIKNNFDELSRLQKLYNEILIKNSNMTTEQLSSILNRRIDSYYDAKQTIELGIADKFLLSS